MGRDYIAKAGGIKNRMIISKYKGIDFVWLIYLAVLMAHNVSIKGMQSLSTLFLAIFSLIYFCKDHAKITIGKKQFECVVWYGLFALFIMISEFWSLEPDHSIIINALQILAMLFSIDVYVTSKERALKLLKSFVYAGIYFAIIIILTSPPSLYGSIEFGSFTGMQRNSIGYLLFFVALTSLILGKQLRKKKFYFFAIIAANVAVLTGSRKVIIMFAMAILLWVYFQEKPGKKLKYAVMIGSVCAAGLSILAQIPYFQATYGERLFSIFNGNLSNDSSIQARAVVAGLAWEMFFDRPLVGYGTNAVQTMFGRMLSNYTEAIYAHNNYLELMADFGIIGTCLYYWKSIGMTFLGLRFYKTSAWIKYILICLLITLVIDYGQVTYIFIYFIFLYGTWFKMFRVFHRECFEQKF
jgi:Lipid A core - O-antigen ligase and related enzymes